MHLVVGLGESDRDVLGICRRLVELGGHSHLFCFFPEAGSLMDHVPAPPVRAGGGCNSRAICWSIVDTSSERCVSIRTACWLISVLIAIDLAEIVATGVPFRTSGCPGKERDDVSACDRPYGDSPPSDIASYPFQPNGHDLRRIRRQLGLPK